MKIREFFGIVINELRNNKDVGLKRNLVASVIITIIYFAIYSISDSELMFETLYIFPVLMVLLAYPTKITSSRSRMPVAVTFLFLIALSSWFFVMRIEGLISGILYWGILTFLQRAEGKSAAGYVLKVFRNSLVSRESQERRNPMEPNIRKVIVHDTCKSLVYSFLFSVVLFFSFYFFFGRFYFRIAFIPLYTPILVYSSATVALSRRGIIPSLVSTLILGLATFAFIFLIFMGVGGPFDWKNKVFISLSFWGAVALLAWVFRRNNPKTDGSGPSNRKVRSCPDEQTFVPEEEAE